MAVLDLAAAKRHLNLTTNTNDAELQEFIDAAVAAVEARVGPLDAADQTATVTSNGRTLVLPAAPVVDLVSVTSLGNEVDPDGLTLDGSSGVVRGVLASNRSYTVVYRAGWADGQVPGDLVLAVKEMVRHLWTTQRGGSKRPGTTPSDSVANTIPGAAYALPIRVEQLLMPHMLPGIA